MKNCVVFMLSMMTFSWMGCLCAQETDLAGAKDQLHHEMGGGTQQMLLLDRLEYQAQRDANAALWDGDAWWGGDINRLWLKSEGEVEDGQVGDAELQALYSRAISPYFNLQTGVRQDFNKGPSRTDAVLGIQGLAPQWFEVDAAAFVSNHGDLTARLETEYELFLTQRLILQPRLELEAAAQDIPALGIGSGLGTVELGLRLRYEIRREVAPYIGIAWQRDLGETADHTRAAGERVQHTALVVGLRLWW